MTNLVLVTNLVMTLIVTSGTNTVIRPDRVKPAAPRTYSMVTELSTTNSYQFDLDGPMQIDKVHVKQLSKEPVNSDGDHWFRINNRNQVIPISSVAVETNSSK